MKNLKPFFLVIFLSVLLYGFFLQSCSKGATVENRTDTTVVSSVIPADSLYKIVYFLTESANQSVGAFLQERALQATNLTCVNYFPTVNMDASGNISPMTAGENSDWNILLSTGKTDGFKVLYSFHQQMDNMRPILQDSNIQANLIGQLYALQQSLGGAGMDFDIEYPASDADTKLLGGFFKNLRAKMGNNVVITADVGPKSYTQSSLGHVEGYVVNDYLNWVNVMCYGAGANNSFNAMTAAVGEYQNKQVNRYKIVIGLPYFAVVHYVNTTGQTVAFNPAYSYLVNNVGATDFTTDSLPYNMNGANPNYLLFNSPADIEAKAKFAKAFGGVMAWHWRADVLGTHSLTDAIVKGKNE